MTTLPLREPARNPFTDALAHVAAFADAVFVVFEVFEEAQALARAADKRYPFAES